MINRALIRLKVVQLIYAYYQNEGKTTEVALKELDFSLQKAYDLYRLMLLLMVELRRRAERVDAAREAKKLRVGGGDAPSNDKLLANNLFLKQLAENEELLEFEAAQKWNWNSEDTFLKKLYDTWLNDDIFLRYVDTKEHDYESDRELVRKLYKNHVEKSEEFDALLEEQSLYWNDDKEIVDSFVVKTIKRFQSENGAAQELLPAYAAQEDQEFAGRLFKITIERCDELRELVKNNLKKWQFNRIAFMDLVVMQIALAEILEFPSIPLNVTFNEYLDIAKVYSTPRSAGFIHGVLEGITKRLKEDGILLK